jgi:hypothetical protein
VSTNGYSVLSERLAALLEAELTQYGTLVVARRLFRPDALPTFTRYCLIVSPPGSPWEEQRTAVREVQDKIRLDIFALVSNFHDTHALFGTVAPYLGLFQLVHDTKEVLRLATFDGLLDKTYDEAAGDARLGGGPVAFQTLATPGFDAGEHSFIYRARIPYLGRLQPRCHARAS